MFQIRAGLDRDLDDSAVVEREFERPRDRRRLRPLRARGHRQPGLPRYRAAGAGPAGGVAPELRWRVNTLRGNLIAKPIQIIMKLAF